MLRILLALAFTLSQFTYAADAAKPRGRVNTNGEILVAPMPVEAKKKSVIQSAACEALTETIRAAAPSAEEQARLKIVVQGLEDDLAEMVDARNNVARDTQVKDRQNFERAMMLLARGDVSELVPLLRPYFRTVYSNFEKLENAYKGIQEQRAEPGGGDRRIMAQFEQIIEQASVPFGENYGMFVAFYSLLSSVAAGEGTGTRNELTLQRSQEEQNQILNLNSELARQAAKRALGILSPRTDNNWTPDLDAEGDPADLETIKTMFRKNIFALIAKLNRDVAEQKQARRVWRVVLHNVANFWMNNTESIPERYRQSILRILGLAYDQIMLERYLGKIQAIVEISRNRSAEGNIVLSSDRETMDLQIKTLLEFNGTAVGNDLMITFARIAYHTELWVNLKRAVHDKAEETKDFSDRYAALEERMNESEKRAKELGDLPYVYKPAIAHHLIFAGSQLAWAVATEEALRNAIIPGVANATSFLTNWVQGLFM